MSVSFNRGQLPQAIAQFFGFKGTLAADLDTQIQPVVSVGDIVDTPYLRYGVPVVQQAALAAVAAENGMVVAIPGVAVALQILQVIITNQEATTQLISLDAMTRANITTAGLASSIQFRDTAATESFGATASLRSSAIVSGTHTSLPGARMMLFAVPAGETLIWTFPAPGIILFGNDPTGIPGLSLSNSTANEAMRGGFFGREWPLPG